MKNIEAIVEIVNKLRVILTRKQKKTGIVILIVIIIGSFLETLGVSAILPFIESLLTPESVMDKWYAKLLISFFSIKDTQTLTIVIGIAIIAIYFLKNLYLYFSVMAQTIYEVAVRELHRY